MDKKVRLNPLTKNILSYGLLQVVNLLVGMVLPRMYLQVYGSEINGIISTANSFVSYFAYIEAGLGAALMHALFKPLADNDRKEISSIVSFSARSYRRISYLYFVLVVASSALFPAISRDVSIDYLEFALLFFVIGLYGAADFYTMAKYRVLLIADRKEYVISLASIAAQLARFALTWAVLNTEASVVVAKTMPVLTLLLRSVILRYYVKAKYPGLSFRVPGGTAPSEDTGKRWDAMLLQISINASSTLPTILISQIMGYKEANVFAIYYLVCSALIAIISAFSSGVAPTFGREIARGKDIRKKYDAYELLMAVILTAVFAIGAALTLPFVRVYTNVVSDVDYSVPVYAVLIMLWGALHSYRTPYTALIKASALYRENRTVNLVNIAILVVSGAALTLLWGITGMLFSMLITAVHRNFSLMWILDANLLPGMRRRSTARMATMTAVILAVYLTLGTFLNRCPIDSFQQWFLWAVAVGLVCLPLTVLVYFLTDRASFLEALRLCKK